MIDASMSDPRDSLARLYHNWITGLVLSLVHRAGSDSAQAFVFALFRDQHLKRFLPGLKKLGLDGEPDAIAAAKYHYFSNQLGGVKVEFLAESDRKAWVRYPPPRWIWDGTAICAVPTAVNAAMMRGWHAHNGVSLGNSCLGFVCTGMTTDGAPGLEGYYLEYDRALSESERLRFAPDEQCPPIDPHTLPKLDSTNWPAARQAKANLNYAMEYIRNGLPLLGTVAGADVAIETGEICARQTGMHSLDFLMQAFDSVDAGSANVGSKPAGDEFIRFLAAMFAAEGSITSADGDTLILEQWALFDLDVVDEATVAMFSACLAGMLSVYNRFASLHCRRAGRAICWQVT